MLFIGDVHIEVSDVDRAIRFWADGLGLIVAERSGSQHAAHVRLDFPDGGPSIRLLSGVNPWPDDAHPYAGQYPSVRFDITTSEFDAVLVRLLDFGGTQIDEVETYGDLRAVTLADPDGNRFELLEIVEDAIGDAEA